MKAALFVILFIHGLIHLVGFAKAFEIYDAKLLTQAISKLYGMAWLLACLFCLTAAGLLIFKNSYWWIFGLLALLVSQTLIIIFWKDAKFGTFANLILLLASIVSYATWAFHDRYIKDVATGLQQKQYFDISLVNEADIRLLPEPVKKYIRYTGSVGKPKVNNFKIAFKGKIRKNEESEWMPFVSEQYNFMETPTRLFFMNALMKKLPVAGYHSYKNGNASMDIRLFSLFRVQYQDGAAMNKTETVTFFNDMCCMAPATLIDKRISWEATGHNQVKASFTNNGVMITADLFFNDLGELINFKSNDRYNADAGKNLPWATPVRDYKEMNGYKLAGYAEAIYTYPDRDLCYGVFDISSITYNGKGFR